MIEGHALLDQRLEDTDMGKATRAAARQDDARRRGPR